MEEIGTYRYPAMSLTAAIDYAKRLQTASKGGPMNLAGVASVLGHSTASSGGFLIKVAELRAYGILEGRADQIRTTQLADHLTIPASPDEFARTVEQVARKVPLFGDLMDRLKGISPDDDAIALQLAAMTGLPRAEIQGHVPRIGKVVRDAITKSRLEVQTGMPPTAPVAPAAPQGQNVPGGGAATPPTPPLSAPFDGIVFDLTIGSRNEHKVGTKTPLGVKSVKRYLENLLKDEAFWTEIEEEAQSPDAPPTTQAK